MNEHLAENFKNALQDTGRTTGSADPAISKILLKAIETTNEIVIVTTASEQIGDEKIIFVNKAFEDVTQYSKEEVLGKSPSFLQGPKTDSEVIEELVNKLSKGEHFEGETFNYKKDGSLYRVRWSIDPIRNEKGQITHFVSVQSDITEEWKQQQQLQEMIRERETLIKESHHRIKNNLATITGLLELQIMKSESDKVREVLSESMNRIQSIASVHEKLYETEGLASISLDIYIKDILEHLENSTDVLGKSSRINMDLSLESITLNTRQAVPLGLILNELVTNAYKHAFDEEGGTIHISCKSENGTVYLHFRDNGKGLPEDLDIQALESLGMKLINTLSKQLNADYKFYSDNGTHFEMSFEKSIPE